jgi:DNA-binding XRE family transcriptional regulator
MPREKELYHDTLDRIRSRADEKYPNKLLYTQKEAADIMGISTKTLYRKGLSEMITAEQLARTFA